MSNYVWATNLDMYLKVCELAKEHGKKPGDSMEEEFMEMREKHPDQFEPLGKTDKDIDVLTGDLREQGVNVLNIKEQERQAEAARGHSVWCSWYMNRTCNCPKKDKTEGDGHGEA